MTAFRNALASTFLLGALLASGQAVASGEAEACIQTKTWSHYDSGWALRTSTTASIEVGKFNSFSATLYGGRKYLVELCGDATAEQVDLVFYDRTGKELHRAKTNGREPMLEYSPEKTQGVFIVAHLRSAQGPSAEVALAILHQ
ncbi:MAG: hypothetical protein VX519_12005 [Myxococcota bacterium]|nr:hypothetical protein [Myxococcota bacterium]